MQITHVFVSVYDVSNLCNPVLEAMICGKCIVSLNDGSLDSITDNGKNRIHINPQKIDEEFPKAIINLLQNYKLRNRLCRQAHIFAENNLGRTN